MKFRSVLALLGVCCCLLGCNQPPTSSDCGAAAPSASAQPVDTVLLAFLSRARSAHHLADRHEDDNRRDAAIAELEKVVQGPLPPSRYPEAREVLADTHARLADLRSRQGQFDDAARNVEMGLGLAAEPTYFRGYLFEMRGHVEERRSQALAAAGQDAEAEAAKQRAVAAFVEATKIQDQVIQQLLGKEQTP